MGGLNQKSVSVPTDLWEEMKKFYHEKESVLRMVGITSSSKLFVVLVRWGMKPFQEWLEKAPLQEKKGVEP